MNRTSVLTAVISVFLLHSAAFSQSQDLPKFELAGEFTTLERSDFGSGRTEPGLGGRFTYNLNRTFSLEAAGYFFPKECFRCVNQGRVIQAVGGLKAGKRFESGGIFGKVRPGIVSFSDGEFNLSYFDARQTSEIYNARGKATTRNEAKILAAINNARRFLAVQEEFGTFDAYIWRFVDGKPIQNRRRRMSDVPARTAESDAMSKDLTKRGFKFVGSTICYAYMQAVGMVNDHLVECFRYGKV